MRPLERVGTIALRALHSGIEKQAGLIANLMLNSNGERCAIGSLSDDNSYSRLRAIAIGLGLFDPGGQESDIEPFDDIANLNNRFQGTKKERREFMLRHIVEELRARGESLVVEEKVEAVGV